MESTSVICGIDLGSWSIKISVFSGDGFQILTNEANFRETPTLVGYTQAERLIGEQALIKIKTNYLNTVRAPQRVLALHRRPHLLQEQLALVKTKYRCGENGVSFFVTEGQSQSEITAEQVLIGLLTKARHIVESHGLKPSLAYLSVPTYWGPEERYGLMRCGELGLCAKVRLVDDWACLGANYAFSRLQELKQLQEMRQVLFLDVGYSKCSLFLLQFTQFQARLLDWQHLPYTGLKNMDQVLLQFYNDRFEKKHKQRPLEHPKALPKLLEAVQKQRTVLSANSDHHLILEYLLAEEDLAYDMNRQEFQDLVVPVLADLAASMAALQSRNSGLQIYALELMGGGSRVPCLQSMATKIFGLEPSRSLNQSEAIASGCAFLAAIDLKLVKFPFSFDPVVARPLVARWKHSKQQLFHPRTRLPCEAVLNLGNQGLLEVTVSLEESLKGRQVAILKVRTPSKVTFSLDANKILSVKSQSLEGCQLYRRSEKEWKAISGREIERNKLDARMVHIYELKNSFQSQFYWCKNKADELREKASKEQMQNIQQTLIEAEKWVEEEHQKHCGGSEQELFTFQKQLQHMNTLKNKIEWLLGGNKPVKEFKPTQASQIKLSPADLKQRYEGLTVEIDSTLGRPLEAWQQDRLVEVMEWGQKAYQEMEAKQWKGHQLTAENIEQAQSLIRTLGRT